MKVEGAGQKIGQYRLIRRLGQGGMAEVFEGVAEGARGFERPVCVKRILSYLSSDPEFRDLFVKEAKIAGALCHSNLVQVFDCVELGANLAIVMELVNGVDLKHLLRLLGRERMPPELAVSIAIQILQGLAFAHERRIVHRDISPHNILISRHGEVKIADFGIAKVMQTHATATGKLKGKLAYMSPEQARARAIDHRTDLYSTGLVLYEMLKGQRYFVESSQPRLILAVTMAERPALHDVDPSLAGVIEKLLEPSAENRFGSAEETLEVLASKMKSATARDLARLVRRLVNEKTDDTGQLEATADPLAESPSAESASEDHRGHKPTLEMWAVSSPEIDDADIREIKAKQTVPSPPPGEAPNTAHTLRLEASSSPKRPRHPDTMETPTLIHPDFPELRKKPPLYLLVIGGAFFAFLIIGLVIGIAIRSAL